MAIETAVFLINRLPMPIIGHLLPFKKLFYCVPYYRKLKGFGCLCYPWLRPYTSSKLQPRSKRCVFLGYSVSQAAYRCIDLVTRRIYVSCHVWFVETQFAYTSLLSKNHGSPESQSFPMVLTPSYPMPLVFPSM